MARPRPASEARPQAGAGPAVECGEERPGRIARRVRERGDRALLREARHEHGGRRDPALRPVARTDAPPAPGARRHPRAFAQIGGAPPQRGPGRVRHSALRPQQTGTREQDRFRQLGALPWRRPADRRLQLLPGRDRREPREGGVVAGIAERLEQQPVKQLPPGRRREGLRRERLVRRDNRGALVEAAEREAAKRRAERVLAEPPPRVVTGLPPGLGRKQLAAHEGGQRAGATPHPCAERHDGEHSRQHGVGRRVVDDMEDDPLVRRVAMMPVGAPVALAHVDLDVAVAQLLAGEDDRRLEKVGAGPPVAPPPIDHPDRRAVGENERLGRQPLLLPQRRDLGLRGQRRCDVAFAPLAHRQRCHRRRPCWRRCVAFAPLAHRQRCHGGAPAGGGLSPSRGTRRGSAGDGS